MSTELYFIAGCMTGIVIMGILLIGYSITARSSQISREEESRGCGIGEVLPPLDPDLLKLDMGEALNRPEPPPPDEDVRSS